MKKFFLKVYKYFGLFFLFLVIYSKDLLATTNASKNNSTQLNSIKSTSSKSASTSRSYRYKETSKVTTKPNVHSPKNSHKIYKVKKGDTIHLIAKKFKVEVGLLKQVNGLTSNRLYIGQTLIIPNKRKSQQVMLPPFSQITEEQLEHRVHKGETIFGIAKKYGLTVGDLVEANRLTDLTIKEGTLLKIPLKKPQVEEPQVDLPSNNQTSSMAISTPEPSPPQIREKKVYHVVKKGETPVSIARTYQTTVKELKKLNNLKTRLLKPGQRLLVKIESNIESNLEHTSSLTLSSSFLRPVETGNYLIHRVNKGETLYRISLIYSVPIWEIKLFNGLTDNNIIVGQELRIPISVESPQLRDPRSVLLTEEEPISRKFERFALSKREIQALRDKFLEISEQYAGFRYRLGAAENGVIDCSAFVQRVYSELGISLPRSSYHQYKMGEKIDLSDLIPGDLVFFKTSRRAPVTHVGIYIGDNKFIHVSSKRKGLAIDSLSDPYFRSRFVGAKRVLNGGVIQYLQESLEANKDNPNSMDDPKTTQGSDEIIH